MGLSITPKYMYLGRRWELSKAGVIPGETDSDYHTYLLDQSRILKASSMGVDEGVLISCDYRLHMYFVGDLVLMQYHCDAALYNSHRAENIVHHK